MPFWIKKYLFDHRLIAILSLCSSVILAISLVSYNPRDPSFNTSSASSATNLLGSFGAYIADLFMQIFGASSLLLILVLLVWSKRLFDVGTIKLFSLRALSLLCAMMLLSSGLNVLAIKLVPAGIGGWLGTLLINDFSLPDALWIGITILASSLFFVLSLGYDLKDLTKLRQSTYEDSGIKSPSIFAENVSVSSKKNVFSPSASSFKSPPSKESKSLNEVTRSHEDFTLPGVDLLGKYSNKLIKPATIEELEQTANELLQVLSDFGVKGRIIDISQGPVVTLYEFEPSAGTKSSRVIGLADDIARSLSAISTRIAVIPGRNVLGIELPNDQREFFSLRDLIETNEYLDAGLSLPVILGKDLGGAAAVVDLAKMPHLLVAGTTGSGKSVAINAMIISLLYRHSPETCKFIMIDPKMLELSVYDGIPHLLTPVVTEPGKAVVALKWAVKEMENRYRLMSNLGVRNIAGYNSRLQEALAKGQKLERTMQTGFDPETGKPIYESVPIEMENLPFIVVIVDEMADLMLVAGKDIESSVQRLAQMARAAGIHIIMATQRPSVDVITGVIKANFPSRVSFKVTSKIDSRTILGEQGAEQLLGMGDMLYMGSNSKIARLHGPFVDDREVENITQFLKAQGAPEYVMSVTEADDDIENMDLGEEGGSDDDSLFRQAIQIIKRERKVSTSYVQRSLRIGYNRAALIIERLEREGIVSAPNHSGKREILLPED